MGWPRREWPALDLSRTQVSLTRGIAHSIRPVGLFFLSLFASLELWIGSRVVEGQFHSDVAGIFALEIQLMPEVILSATRHNQLFQVNPSFSDQVCPLVIIEH